MGIPALKRTTPKITTVAQAVAITGTLSNTSKMPGYSINLPAKECKTGSKLVNVKGSVCENCYALKGRYNFPNVQNAMATRFQGINHPDWSEALSFLIRKYVRDHTPYFRFFDSGDLQSEQHLLNIIDVCQENPNIYFWLPTREHNIVKNVLRSKSIPPNLTIRASGAMVNGQPPSYLATTSTVVTDNSYSCPAPTQNNECESCRKCWDKAVPNVAYKNH